MWTTFNMKDADPAAAHSELSCLWRERRESEVKHIKLKVQEVPIHSSGTFFFVLVRVFLRLCWLVPRTWPTVWSWFDRVVSSPARFTWWKIQILLNLFKPEFSPDVGIRCRPHCRVHLCLKCGHDVVHSPESGPPGDVSRIILCWRFKTPPSLRWGGGSYLE